jgi:hypothetical protein
VASQLSIILWCSTCCTLQSSGKLHTNTLQVLLSYVLDPADRQWQGTAMHVLVHAFVCLCRSLLPVNGSGTHLHLLASHNHHTHNHNSHSDGPFSNHHTQIQLSPLYEGNTPTPHKTGVSAAGLQATPTAAAAPAAAMRTGTGGVDARISSPIGMPRSAAQ